MSNDDPPPARGSKGARGRAVRAPVAPPRGIDVRVSRDGVAVPLALARVQAIAERVLAAERAGGAMIAITFVSDDAIAALNAQHVGHEGATDIVTLEHESPAPGLVVGDIYIAPAVARANATAFGGTTREEIARLTIHGVLHALGWKHPEGARRTRSRMWRRQERLLAAVRRAGLV